MPIECEPLAQAALTVKLMPRRWKIVLRFIVTVEFIDWKISPEPSSAESCFSSMMPGRLDDRFGRGVVAEEDAHLVFAQVGLVHERLLESLLRGHVGIFGLLRQPDTQAAVDDPLERGRGTDPSAPER